MQRKLGYLYLTLGILFIVLAIFPIIFIKFILVSSTQVLIVVDMIKVIIWIHTSFGLLGSFTFLILGIFKVTNKEESFISYGSFICISILIFGLTYIVINALLVPPGVVRVAL